jgi:membrane-associated phospholipid phosphatase
LTEITKDLYESIKANKRLILIFFTVLFSFCALLLTLASFFDLQISKALYNPGEGFSRFLENYGEWPAYVINVGFPIALFVWLARERKLLLSLPPFIFAAVFGYFFSKSSLFDAAVLGIIFNVIAIAAMIGVFLLFSQERLLRVVYLLLLVFVISNLAYLLMLLFKAVWGRARFRDLNGDFTVWFKANGINGHESFFSGHVLSAASLTFLWLMPALFKIKNKLAIACLFGFPALYTISMMYARITAGAHYLSDVVFAVIIFFTFAILVINLTLKKELKGETNIQPHEESAESPNL